MGMHSAMLSEGGLVAGADAEPMDRRPGAWGAMSADAPVQRTTVSGELRRHLCRGNLHAVAEVRGALREQLRRWGLGALVDTAELLASELVTNALVHTDRGAVLTATLTGERAARLRVEVLDFASHRPRARVADDHAAHGRGLMIVQSLADSWGVRSQPVGKTVWFELTAEALRVSGETFGPGS